MAKNIIDASMLIDPSVYNIVSSIPPSAKTLEWIESQYKKS